MNRDSHPPPEFLAGDAALPARRDDDLEREVRLRAFEDGASNSSDPRSIHEWLRAELKKRSFYGFSLEVLVKREPRRGFMIRFSVARLTVSVAVAAFAAAAMGFSGAMGPWTSTLLGLTTFPGLLFLLELGDRSAEIERERLLQVRTQQAEAWLERELQLLIALYADQKQRAERAVARTSERQLPLFQDTGVRHEARPN